MASSSSLSSAVRSCSKSSWLLKTKMQASSLLRKFLTMSFSVAIMAGRLRLVRSEVSIRIPSETASEGAAITLGRFAGTEAAVSCDGGSRNVSSKPIVTFLLCERSDDLSALLVASFRALRVGSVEVFGEREFPLDVAGGVADATRAFEVAFALPLSGVGGAFSAAALA